MSTIKGPSSLEKCRSFGEREKSSFNLLRVGGVPGRRAKGHSHLGHQFLGVQYSSVTLCNVCNGLLWGIGIQGLQCTGTHSIIHSLFIHSFIFGFFRHYCTIWYSGVSELTSILHFSMWPQYSPTSTTKLHQWCQRTLYCWQKGLCNFVWEET